MVYREYVYTTNKAREITKNKKRKQKQKIFHLCVKRKNKPLEIDDNFVLKIMDYYK